MQDFPCCINGQIVSDDLQIKIQNENFTIGQTISTLPTNERNTRKNYPGSS